MTSRKQIMHIFSSKVDGHGFHRPADFDYETHDAFMAAYISVLARRAARWRDLVGSNTKVPLSRKGE
jgi:hypothetical protein